MGLQILPAVIVLVLLMAGWWLMTSPAMPYSE